MMRPDWLMLVAILIAGALVILCFAFFFAFVLLPESEWPGKGWLWDRDPHDPSEVDAWWTVVGRLPDERDAAGDGSDEGLVRVPPDVLLRRTLVEQDGAA